VSPWLTHVLSECASTHRPAVRSTNVDHLPPRPRRCAYGGLKHPPGAIMQTDYSVNTMNLATPETPLTSIGLRPVGFAPTIVRDRPRARRSDSFSGARRGHDARWSSQLRSRAALLRPRGVPCPAQWWSSTHPSNVRRLPKAQGSAEPPSSNVPRLRCYWTRRATSASPRAGNRNPKDPEATASVLAPMPR
jgi:hypothetical protein